MSGWGKSLLEFGRARYYRDMRSRMSLFALLFTVASFAVPLAVHAGTNGGIPFFGPIVPSSINVCPAGWATLITVVNNIISFVLTLAIVFFMPLMIAWAGFLYVVNSVNPEGISKAKSILWHTILGIVIALAAWMIVDALMAVLYTGSAGASAWGTWSSLVTGGGDTCLQQAGAAPGAGLNEVTGITASSTGNILSFGSGPCDANVLLGDMSSLSVAQANTFACLAKPESSCGATLQNYSWNVPNAQGYASTAYGPFQVTLSTNHSCYENQACYTAAGVAGPLNCQNGFGPKGFTAGGNATVLANCEAAAANVACSLSAAVCLLQQQGWTAWTADPRSQAQQSCINEYSGG